MASRFNVGDAVRLNTSNAINHTVMRHFFKEPAHIISGNGRYVIEFDDPGVQQTYIQEYKDYTHVSETNARGWKFPSEWLFKVGD